MNNTQVLLLLLPVILVYLLRFLFVWLWSIGVWWRCRPFVGRYHLARILRRSTLVRFLGESAGSSHADHHQNHQLLN